MSYFKKIFSFSTSCVLSLLFLINESLAQQPPLPGGPPPGPPHPPSLGEVLVKMFPMFVGVFLIFYFLVARPQQQKIKTQETLVKGLKAGDSVVTTGGIVGRVASIQESYVQLEIATNVKIRVLKANIAYKEAPEEKKKS